MITASITWAILSTTGAVAVYLLMRREVRLWVERFWSAVAGWREALRMVGFWRDRAIDAEDRLRKIERSRHASAKHARQAQLVQQRAKLLQTTAKLQSETSQEREAA